MSWFKGWFAKKEPEPTKFRFCTISVEKIGDIYEYELEASSRIEAQRLLIAYFFGSGELSVEANRKINAKDGIIVYPMHSIEAGVRENNIFNSYDASMFAHRIKGARCDKGRDYHAWLEQKAMELGVDINRNY